ncbi:MAG: M12 family metallo-peptidase [Saprospiraceae bacterium]
MRLVLPSIFLLCSFFAAAQERPILIPCSALNLTQINNNTLFDPVFSKKQIVQIDSRMWSMALQNSEQLGRRYRMGWENLPKFDFILQENDILSHKYNFEVSSESGNIIYPKASCFTYEGYILGEPKSTVSLTIRDGFIFGYFQVNPNLTFFIEPANYYDRSLSADAYVIYDVQDVNLDKSAKCGVKDFNKIKEELKLNADDRTGSICRQVELAIASDLSMLTRYGSATAVENHNIGVINSVNTDYRNNDQFADNIEFKIVKQYQSTATATEPLSPVYGGTNSNTILSNFRSWGNAGNFGVNFDLATFWTCRNLDENGAGLNQSLAGLSYVGSVCGSYKYHILEDYLGTVINGTGFGLRVLAAHEIGHAFNCNHDAASNFIMSPVVNNSTVWSAASVAAINSFSTLLPCLSSCGATQAPATSIRLLTDINCTNFGITVKDNSTNGPTTWTWTANGASISPTINSRNVTLNYNSAGLKTISLLAENGIGSNSSTQNVNVFSQPSPSCPIGNTAPANAGISYFEFGPLSKSSGTATADGSEYIDNICTSNAFLSPSTVYPVYLYTSAAGFSNMGAKIYLDYNNNGILNDPYETLRTVSSINPPGNYTLGTVTTSANPTLNTLLRLRVMASAPSDITSPCYDPINGQVEDYGVVFIGSLPLELLSFYANFKDKTVNIEWQTYNEYNNKGFDLERSYDGLHFDKLFFIEGKGTTNYKYRYSVTDQSINCAANQVYYRLKQMDKDGRHEYSKIIAVPISCAKSQLEVFPNPAHDHLQLHISSKLKESAAVILYDFQGKEVWQETNILADAVFKIDISQLPTGIYWIKLLQNNEQVAIKKVIKL